MVFGESMQLMILSFSPSFFAPFVYRSAIFHSSQLAHGGVSVPNCLKHSSFLSHSSPAVRSHLFHFTVVLCGYRSTWLKQIWFLIWVVLCGYITTWLLISHLSCFVWLHYCLTSDFTSELFCAVTLVPDLNRSDFTPESLTKMHLCDTQCFWKDLVKNCCFCQGPS